MKTRKGSTPRSGQVIIIGVVFIAVGLLAVCAWTIDVGHMSAKSAQLQNGADAASLAAMQKLVQMQRDGEAEDLGREFGQLEGMRYAYYNSSDAGVEMVYGTFDPATGFSPVDVTEPANACQVRLYRNDQAAEGPLQLFFAPAIGVDTANVSATAVAQASSSITRVRRHLLPFAVWDDALLPEGVEMIFYPGGGGPTQPAGTDTGSGFIVPGCFGLLDFNGGSNDTPDLIDWITNGYDGAFGVDPATGKVLIDGDTGFRTALEKAIKQQIGKEITICVYDDVWGSGGNATFQVVGFLSMKLTAVDLKGKSPYVKGMVGPLIQVSDVDIGNSGIPSPNITKVVLVQ